MPPGSSLYSAARRGVSHPCSVVNTAARLGGAAPKAGRDLRSRSLDRRFR
jgi:hypothetical protein